MIYALIFFSSASLFFTSNSNFTTKKSNSSLIILIRIISNYYLHFSNRYPNSPNPYSLSKPNPAGGARSSPTDSPSWWGGSLLPRPRVLAAPSPKIHSRCRPSVSIFGHSSLACPSVKNSGYALDIVYMLTLRPSSPVFTIVCLSILLQ